MTSMTTEHRWIKGTYKGVYTVIREDGPWTLLDDRAPLMPRVCPLEEADGFTIEALCDEDD